MSEDQRPYLRDLFQSAPAPASDAPAVPPTPAASGWAHLVAAATGASDPEPPPTPNLHLVRDPEQELQLRGATLPDLTWPTAAPPARARAHLAEPDPVEVVPAPQVTDPDRLIIYPGVTIDIDWKLVDKHVKQLNLDTAGERSRADFQVAIADGPQTEHERDALRDITNIVDREIQIQTDVIGVDRNPWTPQYREAHIRAVFDAGFRYGRLQEYLREPGVEDISIIGCDNVVVYRSDGRVERRKPIARTDKELDDLIGEIAKWRGRAWAHPHGDIDLDIGGARLNATSPAGTRRIGVTIRKHNMIDVDLEDLVQADTITEQMRTFLRAVVRANRTALISGFPGAGKTTMARAWMAEVDPDEKIITIETERELDIDLLPHRHRQVEALQYIPPTDAGEDRVSGFSLKQAFRSALRKMAQMILFGEIRDDEALYALAAMQAGKGSISTIHAEGAADAIGRFADALQNAKHATDFGAPLRQIMRSLDLIVHLEKIPTADGRQRRVVTEICEVQPDPATGTQPVAAQIFYWDYDLERHVMKASAISENLMMRLIRAGLDEDFFYKGIN